MDYNITVPDKIILKGELSERIITLENCHNQDETIAYLKIIHNYQICEGLLELTQLLRQLSAEK